MLRRYKLKTVVDRIEWYGYQKRIGQIYGIAATSWLTDIIRPKEVKTEGFVNRVDTVYFKRKQSKAYTAAFCSRLKSKELDRL